MNNNKNQVPEGWSQTTIGALLDTNTCNKVATILGNGGGARELIPILQLHDEELKAKSVDFKWLAYAIENACQTMKKEEKK